MTEPHIGPETEFNDPVSFDPESAEAEDYATVPEQGESPDEMIDITEEESWDGSESSDTSDDSYDSESTDIDADLDSESTDEPTGQPDTYNL